MKTSVFLKNTCETCTLVGPLVEKYVETDALEIYFQGDSFFSSNVPVIQDLDLAFSWKAAISIVPTLIRTDDLGSEIERVEGWDADKWAELLSIRVPDDFPKFKPGCASDTLAPGMEQKLAALFDKSILKSREISISSDEDGIEACYDRSWSDGLPVVPPTKERVLKMLSGTDRDPSEVLGRVPPNLVECTVEKVAVNAVLAGCLPEYMRVVVASVEAALEDEFCMHGLLATTYFSGPLIIVNGPVVQEIGMNAHGNALGQGNRANATIGRALQLVIRNIGGGKPQGVDRAAFGTPGKLGFCFAEDEAGSCWESLAEEKGFGSNESTVTLFAADGVQAIVDQKSRDPESLARTFASALKSVGHPKLALASDAILVISPEHERVFRLAGWSKVDLKASLNKLLFMPGKELVEGAGGIAEGLPAKFRTRSVPKFRDGGLMIVRAGGKAGMFSAIIPGWGASGKLGSVPVTRKIL
ncbi:MAG: thiol reductase thioredoxin [Gammaproteobacteria bacterium]|nr:thiol reductase thioredoxin [Gammaproteobacteria bacterium]